MSNPISNITKIPSASKNAGQSASADNAPELEIDGPIDPSSPPPLLELDPEDAEPAASTQTASSSNASPSAAATPQKKRGGMSLVAIVLGLLLAGSVALNLKQSHDLATQADTNTQFEMALTAAVDRIDVETVRADDAEATLGGIDGAVDTVNDRVASLLEALTALSEATKTE